MGYPGHYLRLQLYGEPGRQHRQHRAAGHFQRYEGEHQCRPVGRHFLSADDFDPAACLGQAVGYVWEEIYLFKWLWRLFRRVAAVQLFAHPPLLVASRVIQAIGASVMISLSQGIVTGTFPATERGRALGFVGTMVALGNLVGPSLAGVLVHIFSWPSIFIINVPIGLISAVLAFTVIPEIFERQSDKTYDFKGTGLFALFILVLFLGLLLVQQGTLPVLYILPTLIVSAALLAALIFVEKCSTNPIINRQLFSIHEFSFGLSGHHGRRHALQRVALR